MNIIFTAHNVNLPFIKNEIRFLLNHSAIDKIKIFTDFPIEDNEIAFHDKCLVYVYSKTKTPPIKLFKTPYVLYELFCNLKWYILNRRLKELFSFLRNHYKKANFILNTGIGKEDILYAYWAGSGAFILSSLKRTGLNNLGLTRLHAFDIYEDGDNKGHIPWRNYIYRNLDHLVTISDHGRNYLMKRFPYTKSKVATLKLGIPMTDYTINSAPASGLELVSCSWVGKRKNLEGVFRAFSNVEKARWTHLGDGEDFDELKNAVLFRNSKLQVRLMGRLEMQQIHSIYSNEKISCFISLSTNEGLPVSMMEAMAHGIPVVCTDVGGCSELINEHTGILLPKKYTDEDVRKAVYLCAEKFRSREARQKIKDFIKENFDAEKNYGKFVDFLEKANREHHKKLVHV